ncbi:MAG: cation-translocating P-type ATPase [Anaerolineales bacterium]
MPKPQASVQQVDENQRWHTLSSKEVLERLGVAEHGLNSEEVKERLEQYGPNQLTEAPRPGFWALLWAQLNNFVVILLIVASVISILLGETVDALAIMTIVVLNAILGIVQEQRAEQALAALRKLAAPEAHVLRDGERITVPSGELVPGDIVYLEAGNFVPADARLLETVNMQVEEASLTGESLPVQKNATLALAENIPLGDRKNTAFMGTLVTYGRGRGVVIGTGMRTQLGLIAAMLQTVEDEETPLQRRLDELGKTLSIGALVLVGIVFLVAILHETEIGQLFSAPLAYFGAYAKALTDAFLISVSLAIAAVPEGLPAVVTISLALGMQEMIRRHALIRKLSSVETLGSATVICSDKTGTLTQNQMTVTRLWAGGQLINVTGTGYAPKGNFLADGKPANLKKFPAILTTLWLGVINNDAEIQATEDVYRVVGDPTEAALLVAATKADIIHEELDIAYPRRNEVPFDSERKRMITVHHIHAPKREDASPFDSDKQRDWHVIAVKGAPDVVLDLCKYYQTAANKSAPLNAIAYQRILDANDAMTKDALRALGVAYRVLPKMSEAMSTAKMEEDLVFVGLIGMIDPAREEVKPALSTAAHAGIRTVMITGDYPATARAIAEEIGLLRPGKKVLTGAELDAMDDAQLNAVIEDTDVFARVSPEHKMRIVDALQANGEVVAMTGDGVNDAPAIKRADIGVAMGITGTDVAKETADMVLTDDNYASIVSAVMQGRIIYGNIRKFVFFLLSSNVAEIMVIFLATLAGLPPPLTAIQLLWLNLITDGAPALALALEKGDPDVMERKPRPRKEPIINAAMRLGIVIQTIVQTGAVLSAFALGLLWELTAMGHAAPQGMNPLAFLLGFDWRSVEMNAGMYGNAVHTAETMAFITLSLCELLRAYTVRSERASLFSIGVFSNKWMQYAVGASIGLLLLVCIVPFLQIVFNTHWLSMREWAVVLSLSLIPAVAEEATKMFLRRSRG